MIAVAAYNVVPGPGAPTDLQLRAKGFEACVQLVRAQLAPTDFHVDRWAIRSGGLCWSRGTHANVDVGPGWMYEPTPSSRDDAFFADCRYTLEEVCQILDIHVPVLSY